MKRVRILLAVAACTGLLSLAAAQQLHLPIYNIQGEGLSSAYIGQEVGTHGVVTLVLNSGSTMHFFMQDTAGDGNPATSDGIYVYGAASTTEIEPGDYITLTATIAEYNGCTELTYPSNITVMGKNVPIPFAKVNFYNDVRGKEEQFEGMALEFDRLYYNSGWGGMTLGSTLHRAPTDYNAPGSDEYRAAVKYNQEDRITLSKGMDEIYYDESGGECRLGSHLEDFKCVLHQNRSDSYQLYAQDGVHFKGNPRTAAPSEADLTALGAYNTKICGLNLENFHNESNLQRTRIVNALKAIDADIYGFVEVGYGSEKINRLVQELNTIRGGGDIFDFIKWGGYEPASSYTCVHMVYDKTKWEPVKDFYMISQPTPTNRKLIQAFRHKETGFVFIFNLNHFKAKSGTGSGADADQGDGQGIYNNQRTREAAAMIDKLELVQYYYGTDKIICMGDFNAFYMEDPIRLFVNAGYTEQNHRFHDDYYSYRYSDYIQYLDYAFTSETMERCVTGATIWHVNCDEPSSLDYDRDQTGSTAPYRYSDHDPVIVGFNAVANEAAVEGTAAAYRQLLRVYPNPVGAGGEFRFMTEEAGYAEIRSLQGALLWRAEVNTGETFVNASNWPSGMYVITLHTPSGKQAHGKLVIK